MPDLRIANAPCSYGAFELTVDAPGGPDPVALLDAVAGAGYEGIDLGPLGYLGDGAQLRQRLGDRSLGLAGGYLALSLGEGATFAEVSAELERMLDVFDLVGAAPAPRPTLADAGSRERFAQPGRAGSNPDLGLDAAAWSRFAATLARAVERCRERGYEPTFHPHAGTYVESVGEIEKLLELSDVGLCFDSGHLMVGGAEPLSALRDWAPRINHLHLKDVDCSRLEAAIAAGDSLDELFRRRVFCAFGEGDIPLPEICAEIRAADGEGWLVVEQDVIPDQGTTERAVRDQVSNREYLRGQGL